MKNLLLLVALAIAVPAHAYHDNDTLIVKNARKVMVIAGDSLQKIEIEGMENDSNYHYSNTIQLVDSNYVSTGRISSKDWGFSIGGVHENRYSTEIQMHLAAGFNGALATPAHMTVRPLSSWEIFWYIAECNVRLWKHNRDQLALGIALDWRNYRMKDDYHFVRSADDVLSVAHLPEGATPKFSRIKVFSLSFPVLYKFNSGGKGFRFEIGPVVNLNLSSSAYTKYKIDGHTYKEKLKDVHATPVTVDLLGVIDTPFLKYYIKYSPCRVLDKEYGPSFSALSFGLYF